MWWETTAFRTGLSEPGQPQGFEFRDCKSRSLSPRRRTDSGRFAVQDATDAAANGALGYGDSTRTSFELRPSAQLSLAAVQDFRVGSAAPPIVVNSRSGSENSAVRRSRSA